MTTKHVPCAANPARPSQPTHELRAARRADDIATMGVWVPAMRKSQSRGGGQMSDKSDRASGKVKEAAGKATGNERLAGKGRREQVKGDVKKSGKKLKDAAKKM